MRPVRISAPASPLVTLEDLRQQVRAGTAEEDALLEAYERAAVDWLDGYSGRLGRCILAQTWAMTVPFGSGPALFTLPFPDCRDLTVERPDGAGGWEEFDAEIQQDGESASVSGLPSDATGYRLKFVAGWSDPSEVPNNLKQAVRFIVTHWSENRSAVISNGTPSAMPFAVEAMISPLIHVFPV